MSVKYSGKYRGVVINDNDPMQMGRIQVQVPEAPGLVASTWAMPCVPCNLPKKAGSALPNVGAAVWIEFEQGNPDHPIWSGCWFGNTAQTPPALKKRP